MASLSPVASECQNQNPGLCDFRAHVHGVCWDSRWIKIFAMHRCKKAEKVENTVCWTVEACHAEALCPLPLADVGM